LTTLARELSWIAPEGDEAARALMFYRDNPESRAELSSEDNVEAFEARRKGYDPQKREEYEAQQEKKRQEESEKDAALIARVKADRERRRNERKK
jgi:hypothetical protein